MSRQRVVILGGGFPPQLAGGGQEKPSSILNGSTQTKRPGIAFY
jgi:hypothetical protein